MKLSGYLTIFRSFVDLDKNIIAWSLVYPELIAALPVRDWDLLIRQGRRSMLLARLCHFLKQRRLLDRVPERPRFHLVSETKYAEKLEISTRWEVRCIIKALSSVECPVVFLKGAGYLLAGDSAAGGRLFSDIDILVPKDKTAQVEKALQMNGWVGSHQNEYDQRYYREWMHELPPMIHLKRQTTLDVHYNILPEVGRNRIDIGPLFARSIKPGEAPVRVLSPEDRVIHSAAHLFHNGEMDMALRDLSDLDLLLRQFSGTPGFWERLCAYSHSLGLGRSLFYALRYAAFFFQTPIPEKVTDQMNLAGPGLRRLKGMDALFLRALMPDHSSCDDNLSGVARWALFLRAHWLRMPPRLLLPHLAKKTMLRWQQRGHLK